MLLAATGLFLDQAGHVYLPLAGPDAACLRLNHAASALWRTWLSGPVDVSALDADAERFLQRLLDQGSLVSIEAPQSLAAAGQQPSADTR